MNHQFNFPGRVVWDPITITFVDMPGDNGAQTKLMAALKSAGYGGPEDAGAQGGTEGLSKNSAVKALGDVTITQLKAEMSDAAAEAGATPTTHVEGEQWTLKNAYIQDVKFGNLDYGSEDAVQVVLTIRYDWATAAKSTGAGDADGEAPAAGD